VPESTGESDSGPLFILFSPETPTTIQSENAGVIHRMRTARSFPPVICRRAKLELVKRALPQVPASESGDGRPVPVLHSVPPHYGRGTYLHFESFDDAYLDRLRAGDFRTQEHFSAYFSALIRIKLRSRSKSPEIIEDVRQETFSRFFVALREGKILHPDRLGSYVNSMCSNVALEYFRASSRNTPLDEEEQNKVPSADIDLADALASKEVREKVREILDSLSERDRRLLREVFLEERDKDEVCRDFGVDREYLRVLLHRAKQAFKTKYLKASGGPPYFALA
jgi:RNA polymerase sigma-70 factor, ECF subfamily